MLAGTLSFADLYGPKTPAGDTVSASPVEKSTGGLPGSGERAPGIAVAGLIVLLVAWRVLAEVNPAVGG